MRWKGDRGPGQRMLRIGLFVLLCHAGLALKALFQANLRSNHNTNKNSCQWWRRTSLKYTLWGKFDMQTKKYPKYPVELKQQAVESYLEGHSVSEIVSKFDIKNPRRIYDWVARVKECGYEGLNDRRGLHRIGTKKNEDTLEEKYMRLKLENEYLKKLLDLQRG